MDETTLKSLVSPRAKAPQGRKVWAIDLESVIVPFFLATNTTGDTAIPRDALGAPLRLGYNKDGTVKFRTNGRPVIQVAKPIRDGVALLRENFVANLVDHTRKVVAEHKDEYAAEVALCRKAGEPIVAKDKENLDAAIKARQEAEMLAVMEEAEKQNAPAADRAPEMVPA